MLTTTDFELNLTTILLIVGILVGTVLFYFMIYKIFKKCCMWSMQNQVKIFSLPAVIVYSIPFFIFSCQTYYRIEYISFNIVKILFLIFLIIPTVLYIIKHGIKYGLLLSFFRIIAAFVCSILACGILATIAILVICGGFAISIITEKSFTMVTMDGEIFSLKSVGDGTYVDLSGRIFWKNGDNSFVDDNGNIYFMC